MTAVVQKRFFTPAEYLALERAAEHRSEYYRGEIFAMAGTNERHNIITLNIGGRLRTLLRTLGCKPYVADMRVKVTPTGLYTYPDVVVACDPIQFEGEQRDTLLNPRVIFEVLSPTTEARDRGWKWEQYRKLPSLIDYVLVSQSRPLVEHFVRQPDDSWNLVALDNLERTLQLAVVQCALSLAEIYLDVEFDPEPGQGAIAAEAI